jgi:hypothetical protein
LLAKAGAEAITPAATSAEINSDFMLNSLLCEKNGCAEQNAANVTGFRLR